MTPASWFRFRTGPASLAQWEAEIGEQAGVQLIGRHRCVGAEQHHSCRQCTVAVPVGLVEDVAEHGARQGLRVKAVKQGPTLRGQAELPAALRDYRFAVTSSWSSPSSNRSHMRTRNFSGFRSN